MRLWSILALGAIMAAGPAWAQDPMAGVDLSAPKMTEAGMTRAEVAGLVASGRPVDLSGQWLNGLDLSGLDLSGVNLRAASLNRASLRGTRLAGAVLDQAWMLGADLAGANLDGASLFQTQLRGATLVRATARGARAAGDFTGADLTGADFTGADFSADMRNQSMGLMRGVLRQARAAGAIFRDARMARADMEFADLSGAPFLRLEDRVKKMPVWISE